MPPSEALAVSLFRCQLPRSCRSPAKASWTLLDVGTRTRNIPSGLSAAWLRRQFSTGHHRHQQPPVPGRTPAQYKLLGRLWVEIVHRAQRGGMALAAERRAPLQARPGHAPLPAPVPFILPADEAPTPRGAFCEAASESSTTSHACIRDIQAAAFTSKPAPWRRPDLARIPLPAKPNYAPQGRRRGCRLMLRAHMAHILLARGIWQLASDRRRGQAVVELGFATPRSGP
ncbi:hypothetical protein PCL_05328 [Purpureocillium lilacinum]|uniref:Uncharacterized protein n=1 Tax=Purpureocillium lilacinum TaxID=33203 RepID=A0A2U3DV32_PURLI|nr:hypothetical protein PCL_05328 [Purpureocillium lilacinum]